jgi:hypothetical protein
MPCRFRLPVSTHVLNDEVDKGDSYHGHSG